MRQDNGDGTFTDVTGTTPGGVIGMALNWGGNLNQVPLSGRTRSSSQRKQVCPDACAKALGLNTEDERQEAIESFIAYLSILKEWDEDERSDQNSPHCVTDQGSS